MSQKVYMEQILQPIVSQWLSDRWHFTLEEDNDSGHGTRNYSNIVAKWKKEHKLS